MSPRISLEESLVLEKRAIKSLSGYHHEMDRRKKNHNRGIVRRHKDELPFEVQRYEPDPALADFVQDYWFTRWDLTGSMKHRQEVLPHPCVNAVVDIGSGAISGVVGVVQGRFERVLSGQGCAFGIKFWPGGFHAFLGAPLSTLTDRRLGFAEIFGEAGFGYEREVTSATSGVARIQLADHFLIACRPCIDDGARRARAAVACIADEKILRVDDLVDETDIPKRSLQRLFGEYVGVPPKWVIQRYRLHEAVERLHHGHSVDFAALAVQLGYFDQAHFNLDFRAWLGCTPSQYERALGARQAP